MKRSEKRSKRINGIEQFYRNQRMTELQKNIYLSTTTQGVRKTVEGSLGILPEGSDSVKNWDNLNVELE